MKKEIEFEVFLKELKFKEIELNNESRELQGRYDALKKSTLNLAVEGFERPSVVCRDYFSAQRYEISSERIQKNLLEFDRSSSRFESTKVEIFFYPQFYVDLVISKDTFLPIKIQHEQFNKDYRQMAFKSKIGEVYLKDLDKDFKGGKIEYSFNECLEFFKEKEVPREVLNKLALDFKKVQEFL